MINHLHRLNLNYYLAFLQYISSRNQHLNPRNIFSSLNRCYNRTRLPLASQKNENNKWQRNLTGNFVVINCESKISFKSTFYLFVFFLTSCKTREWERLGGIRLGWHIFGFRWGARNFACSAIFFWRFCFMEIPAIIKEAPQQFNSSFHPRKASFTRHLSIFLLHHMYEGMKKIFLLRS